MSAPIRVGVVGTGYLGRFHAEKYARMRAEGVELVGVADLEISRAEEVVAKIKETTGVETKAFRTAPELALAGAQAVSVVVPTHVHHYVARGLLNHGVDCLVEKPFAVTLDEADDLIAVAKKHGRVLQVGHLERFNPVMLGLKDKIHHPMFVESHRLAPFGERGTEVDVILDLMIHDLDIILMAVQSEVVSVSAVGIPVLTDKIDIANARLEFASGCVANVTASRVSGSRMRKIRLFQADAYLSIDYQAKNVTIVRKQKNTAGKDEIGGELLEIKEGDALEAELRSFINAVRTRGTPEVTGEDGRRALALAHAIGDAIRERAERVRGFVPESIVETVLKGRQVAKERAIGAPANLRAKTAKKAAPKAAKRPAAAKRAARTPAKRSRKA
ncbi:MAG TPA: Gfo/Idh/MocA family oxidoreductase [bacterium]|nr:Gfo/Idh/MocA family oxidoreductase [bacterium]